MRPEWSSNNYTWVVMKGESDVQATEIGIQGRGSFKAREGARLE